ncbi:hypothetical protein [Pseudonocardia sp. WMMC193]|uniref:hypothetical protein n=1 Tax=Pseudonocardia sp. WMMC193 TaxID=2911965 RepID=UPI001F2E058C|nr:hypothetical protein [Pseudonocardia sp. WMMC193]MCF7548412.1 hypothetical protein [Pseudonocardia sp. WMMC193]
MSDWFLAAEDAAEGIAAGEFDDLPHLSIPLRRTELAALYAALTDTEPDDPRAPAGLLAVEADAGVIVTRVPAEALEVLAEMTPRTAPPIMARWSAAIGHGEPDALGEQLSELAAFARDAAVSGRPVLQLAPY